MNFYKGIFVFVLLLQSVFVFGKAEPLPNWLDLSREKFDPAPVQKTKLKPNPPPRGFRFPAEYEPVRAVVIGNMGFSSMLQEIMRIAYQEAGAEIWAASLNSVNFPIAPEYLFRSNCPLNTVWVRDYGPFGLSEDGTLGIVDSIYRHYNYRRYDDNFPTCLAREKNVEPFSLPLILDGGNLMVDSQGTLFMTKRTYQWNSSFSKEEVDQKLKEYFHVKNIVATEFVGYPGSPMDGTGHIDMILKLVDDNTFVLAESNEEPFKSTLERVKAQLEELTAPNGKPYRIFRLPSWYSGRTWYTYTNSLIVNGKVLMPHFAGHENQTELAMENYLKANPSLDIIPIESSDSITYGGSIHCVTQTIPL